MSATRVQSKSGNGAGYLESYGIVMTSDVTAGSLLVLFVSEQNAGYTLGVTDSQGNTWVKINDGINTYTKGSLWYVASAAAGATTITVSWGAGNYQDFSYAAREYSGLSATPLDVTAEVVEASYLTSHPTGTTASTAQDTNLVVAAYAGDGNATYTISGFSNRLDANHSDLYGSMSFADKDITSAAAQSGTFESNVGLQGYATIAVFKEAATTHTIAPQDGAWTFAADNATIAQNHILSPSDAAWTFQADNTTIAENKTIVPDDAAWTFGADSVTLAENYVLVPQDASWLFGADNSTVSHNHILTLADAAWVFVADQLTIDYRDPPLSSWDTAPQAGADWTPAATPSAANWDKQTASGGSWSRHAPTPTSWQR